MSQTQKRDWNSTAAGWKKWQPISENAARTATKAMLDMAGIQLGDRVIDFATGLGDTAAACARRVGPTGQVLATDGADAMLEFARGYMAELELSNVSFKKVDFNDIAIEEAGFDAGICRWGLMFAEDLVATLSSLRGLLRPGGCFSAIVWGPPERAEVQTLTNTVLMESLGLPPVPTGKGTPFALSDRDALEQEFAKAGFSNVESQTVSVVYDFKSAEEYVQYRRERSSLDKNIAHCPEADRAKAWEAVTVAARKRARPDRSVRFVSETTVIAGQNAIQQYF
jgi:ubiquinone/menaquinone biosynthesis C-methylase UbiE